MATRDDIVKIADLARISVPESEIDRYVEQMARIIDYVGQLDAVDVGDTAPMMHAGKKSDVFREDQVQPGLTVSEALAPSAEHDDEFFRVPKTL